MDSQSFLALATIAFCALSLVCLLTLHVVSTEFAPSWRMVSEYALGRHKWLLTCFFVFWSMGSFALSFFTWPIMNTGWGAAGVIVLFISSVGGLMGGLFDVNHKLHGLAALLGVPTLPIAALLIGYNLVQQEFWADRSSMILMTSHLTWVVLVLMAVTMIVMMNGFKKAGIPMGPDTPPPDRVPEGVIALAGYANRLLIACNMGWLIVIAYLFLSN
jgi:hypothetical protein